MKKSKKPLLKSIISFALVIMLVMGAVPMDALVMTAQAATTYSGFIVDDGSGGFSGADFDETHKNLVDGDADTKWCADNTHKSTPGGESGACYWVDFHYGSAIQVNRYSLTTGGDNSSNNGRNPKSWVLKAKTDQNGEWSVIATVNNDKTMEDKDHTAYDFGLDVPGTYQYFRFMISENHGAASGCMQLSELTLSHADLHDLASATVSGLQAFYIYTGEPIDVVYTIKSANGETLEKGTNFTETITPSTVQTLGNYTLTISGKDPYYGSIEKNFKVARLYPGLGTAIISDPIAPDADSDTEGWTGSYVYYGKYDGSNPTKYRVLDRASGDFGVVGGSLLLDCDSILYNKKFHHETTATSNVWSTSDIRADINGDGFLNKAGNLTSVERSAIAASTKSQAITSGEKTDGSGFERLGWAELSEDHIFFLDAKEATRPSYGYMNTEDNDSNKIKITKSEEKNGG